MVTTSSSRRITHNMISDVLFDAVQDIDRYLSDPVFNETYQGSLRTRILLVRHAMDDLREELDTPPQDSDVSA
jgi:hypothetical protein